MATNNSTDAHHNHANPKTNKVLVRQLPKEIDWSDFEKCLKEIGDLVHCDHTGSSEYPSAIVTYKTSDQAHTAVEKLSAKGYKDHALKASLVMERSGQSAPRNSVPRRPGRPMSESGGGGYGGSMRPPACEIPLRMVVNSKCVGAIIGQGGSNIRQITKDSKARCVVDVTRGIRDNTGNIDKVINIYGMPENASKACIKILEIVQREMQNDQQPDQNGANQHDKANGEAELKLRAHNNLVGRLIGKGGGTIRKIMEETGCSIFVSNIGELSAFNMERTITIRGANFEKISQAEHKISNKLRQCFENDVTNAPHTLYGGMHPLMTAPSYGGGGGDYNNGYAPPMGGGMVPPGMAGPYGMSASSIQGQQGGMSGPISLMSVANSGASPQTGGMGGGGAMSQQNGGAGQTEIVHVWVPGSVVGALIGTKGSHIRNVMRMTGAHIRIDTSLTPNGKAAHGDEDDEDDRGRNHNRHHDDEDDGDDIDHRAGGDQRRRYDNRNAGGPLEDSDRRVTITGTDQQQYKAQFWIFQRVCEQGYHFFDEVRLCTEIQVPSRMVGRIIGKGGQNVRELQRVTGAQVKIPEDVPHDSPDDTVVRIVGNFNAAQAVQAKVRQLTHVLPHGRNSGN